MYLPAALFIAVRSMLSFDYHPLNNNSAMARRPLLSLVVLVPILMIDAIIELSFVSAMVGFLHGRGSKPFKITNTEGRTIDISGTPETLLENQGHTSNGAAGTAFILIGIGGLLAIWLQHRRMRSVSIYSETPRGQTNSSTDWPSTPIGHLHLLGCTQRSQRTPGSRCPYLYFPRHLSERSIDQHGYCDSISLPSGISLQ